VEWASKKDLAEDRQVTGYLEFPSKFKKRVARMHRGISFQLKR
jgi:hypothetical protein